LEKFALDKKQKRAFHTALSGLKFAKFGFKDIRFLTLTTSDLMFNTEGYIKEQDLENHMRIFIKRVKRYSPWRLYKEGYITHKKMQQKYRNNSITKKFIFEYFRVQTNEGNGVMHILYRGSWLPYNFISDNWMDIHNSWDINIKLIDSADPKESAGYIVSQYVSNQECSYVRSSQSWNWVFRGYKELWYNMRHFYRDNLFELWDNILKSRAGAYFVAQTQLMDYG